MTRQWLVFAMVLFSIGLAGCSPQGSESPASESVESAPAVTEVVASVEEAAAGDSDEAKLAVAQDMLDAWTALDWERVYDLFGEDGVLANMMIEPVVGNQALRERLVTFENGLERMDFIILRMGVINGEVVVERIDSFDFNGKTGLVPVMGVMNIEGGQVKEWREYYDRYWLMSQMGVIEGEPPHPVESSEIIIDPAAETDD